jgi:hypothetical protein
MKNSIRSTKSSARSSLKRVPHGIFLVALALAGMSQGRTIWIADAHRDGKSFVVQTDGR